MTIRQLLIGTAIGATALGTMLHRITKLPATLSPLATASLIKGMNQLPQARSVNSSESRVSTSKLYGRRPR